VSETIPALVEEAAARWGDRAAVVDGETRLGFAALGQAAADAARAFIARGIERGDRVAVWAPNSWEWVVAALGAQSAGASLVPINTRFKGGEAADVLARSGARALVTVNGFLDVDYVGRLRASGHALPALRFIVVARGAAPGGTLDWRAFLDGGAAVPASVARARARAVDGTDVSDVLYTSGTTGRSKGVLCTHAQTLRAFRAWSETVGLRADDRYLIVNPFFHGFGYKAGWLACLLTGALDLPEPVFDAGAVLARIARDRVTVLPAPPTVYQALLAHPARARTDLSSLRLAVTGAAVVPVELVRRMRDELGFSTVLTAYGLTESSGVATISSPGDPPETIATTCGRAIPGTEVKIVAAPGEPGEVCLRGYHVMKGYDGDPAATAAAVDGDGWLHTGDVGLLDDAGYLRITDRLKDMFIVGGFKAYPAEIERLLLLHPAVQHAAVIGVPDARLGEVGMAFVVLRPNATASGDELVAWARETMANFKAPRTVRVVAELPLNATGKVRKDELRKLARGA
jgi:acyl-CoA synthetase (AMP-forming)/AMP-acid ligase II